MDIVGTCPKTFWDAWLEEGDLAGEENLGDEYEWYTRHPLAQYAKPGDRFYVVGHGKLRGYAPVVRLEHYDYRSWAIVRAGGAIAITIPDPIPGFRGLRQRWWERNEELPFPDWQTP